MPGGRYVEVNEAAVQEVSRFLMLSSLKTLIYVPGGERMANTCRTVSGSLSKRHAQFLEPWGRLSSDSLQSRWWLLERCYEMPVVRRRRLFSQPDAFILLATLDLQY